MWMRIAYLDGFSAEPGDKNGSGMFRIPSPEMVAHHALRRTSYLQEYVNCDGLEIIGTVL
jgi:hypothetical protein